MMYHLRVRFPKDFEERYKIYKVRFVMEKLVKNQPSNELQKLETEDIKKFPYKLPRGTVWENFIIKFLDNENVLISVVGKTHEADYREMCFEDKRNGKSNLQWIILFALAQNGGEISWKNPEASEKYKKGVERLANRLRDYFSIDYDPFHPYKENNSYKIKITLIPPVVTDTDEIKDPKEELTSEIEEMFKELDTDETY